MRQSDLSLPLSSKLSRIVLMTCGLALLLAAVGFLATELVAYRQFVIAKLGTLSVVTATNSTRALLHNDRATAREIIAALAAEPNIVAAALYDGDSELFASYPSPLPRAALPYGPSEDSWRIEDGYLVGEHAILSNDLRIGTLVLKSDMSVLYAHLRVYALTAVTVVLLSLLAAWLLSRRLQRQISQPILELAQTARAISKRHDYSVRAATSPSADEVGLLTNAFNQMLAQIQTQHEALQDSEGRVRAVLDSAMSAVIVMDAAGRIVDWNARAETMFERRRDDVLGRDLAETIIPQQHRPAHRAGLARYLATGEATILNRQFELTALRHDGSEFPTEVCISPLRMDGKVTFCGFITDITERKTAERRIQNHVGRLDLLNRITRAIGDRQDLLSIFRVVLRNLEDELPVDFGCVLLYDAVTETLTVSCAGGASSRLATQLGIVEQAHIPIDANGLSRCVRGQLVYEPDTAALQFAFPQLLASAGLSSLVIAPLLAESRVFGVLVAARHKTAAFSSGDCEFLRQLSEHVALAAHQAQLHTALQEAYDDLRQSQKAVLQQERLRALGQMASGVAHDINNAISPVALYTEALLEREPNLSARARSYLATIQRAIEDVAQTVARMREFYRPRESQLLLTRVDLNKLAEQVIDLTSARWSNLPQERGHVIEVRTELAAGLPDVMGMESEIRDALTNLIFNAVDAMPAGGILTVRTRSVPDPAAAQAGSGRVELAISDTGTGMSEATRRQCLEPFFTTKGERGTGLGLPMVYGMAQRHNAELEIDSELGHGTTVRLSFAAAVNDSTSAIRLPTASGDTRQLRILIVDDDPAIIASLRETLEGDGHRVVSADGGRRGIELFSAAQVEAPFQLVITDLGMPHVDGRQVAAAVKALSPGTPVLLLTGWGQRLNEDNEALPNVDRVLNKPPRLRELRMAIAEISGAAA